MRTRRSAVAGLAVGAAMTALGALTANAALPIAADTVDASGAENGCRARVKPFLQVVTEHRLNYNTRVNIECPTEAGVKRVSQSIAWYEVVGGERVLLGRGDAIFSDEAGILTTSSLVRTSCTDLGSGDHRLLARARLATKQTVTNEDPNPFVAQVGRVQTVSCP